MGPSGHSSAQAGIGERTRCSFKEAQLRVGDPMFIECPRMLDKLRDRVSITGWLDGKFLITTAPQNPTIRDALKAGEDVIFRTFHGRTAFAFRTSVMTPVRAPAPLVFFDYPAVVECTTIRNALRSRVELPARMSIDDQEHTCVIRNLSAQGALLETRQALKQGDVLDGINLSFELQGVPVEMKLTGEVRRVEPDTDGARGQYGLEFKGLQASEKLALSGYVTHQILKDRSNAI